MAFPRVVAVGINHSSDMRNVYTTILLCLFGGLFLVSCDDDVLSPSPIAMFISPSAEDTLTLESGDKTRYALDFHVPDGQLSRLTIKSFDSYLGEKILMDTSFQEKLKTYTFVYTAPLIDRDSIISNLEFIARSTNGDLCNVKRTVLVKNSLVLISEKTGIVLRNGEDGLGNAIRFDQPTQPFNSINSPDSALADFLIETDAEFLHITAKSNTVAKFVRSNSFDYAMASAPNLQAVYQSSTRCDVITNLQTNDIILVGHGDRAEGVIRISNIVRTETSSERCVVISYKGVSLS